jgi:cell division protein FtsQ
VIGVRIMQPLTWLALVAAAALLLAAAAVWFAQRTWFDFRRIEIGGDVRHMSVATVRSAVSGRLAGNYFTMNLDQARRAFESLPWVASASVRRIWPNRLSVTLEQHRALGQWDDGRLVSDRGALFVANPAEAENELALVAFSGPTRFADQAVRNFQQFAMALKPLEMTVVGVHVSERASWRLELMPKLRIELGRDDPPGRLQERLDQIVGAMPVVVARLDGPAARIDARYSNGFAATGAR